MSVNKKAALVFKSILENHSDLLTNENWQELQQLSQELPDDDEEVTEKIETWLKSHPSILQVYKQNLNNMDPSLIGVYMGPGGTKSPTPPNQPSESSKELIQNAIKKNSPLPNNTNYTKL
jgi:hypothetical protein